jgi:hypothetical protein
MSFLSVDQVSGSMPEGSDHYAQPTGVKRARAKQIVLRYNGDPTTEESVLDMDSDKSVPEQGSFILSAKENDGR